MSLGRTVIQIVTAGLLSVFATCSVAAGFAKAPAETDPAGNFNSQFNGEPPSDLVSIASDMLAIVDHSAGLMVFVHATGAEIGRTRLPSGFSVERVRTFPDRTVLVDAEQKLKIVLPRSHTNMMTLPKVAALSLASGDPDDEGVSLVRRTARRLGIAAAPKLGFSSELKITGITPGFLASATFLGMDHLGRAYTLAREIELIDTDDGGVKRRVLRIVATLGRHDASGTRTEVATVPLDRLFKTPRGRYLTVEPDGAVVGLLPLRADADASKSGIYLFRPNFVTDLGQSNPAKPMASAAKTQKLLADSQKPFQINPIPSDDNSSPVETKDAGAMEPSEIAGRRTKAKMKAMAQRILGFKWTASNTNLATGAQSECWFGKHDAAHAFELPHGLKRAKPGDLIVGVPYNWGGKASLETIASELGNGFRAGNICSEADDQSPKTTGLDCSGFIGQVWGVQEFGTSGVHAISDPLPQLSSLRWGDVFNYAGHHIRLYVGDDVSKEFGMRIRTFESTSACGGACDHIYDIEHFHGYEIRRLRAKK